MRNEKASYIGPGHADSGTEHSVLEAETQLEEDPRPGTAEKDGDDSCAFESGA